jgi:hypothetical protein
MKNWFIPIAVVGLSGLGLLCISEKGQEKVQQLFDRITRGDDPLSEFSSFLDQQLTSIQRSLDHLAEALEQNA